MRCRSCGNQTSTEKNKCSLCGCPACSAAGSAKVGWCACGWELVSGAKRAWQVLHPPDHQATEKLRQRLGLPADVVGAPILPKRR